MTYIVHWLSFALQKSNILCNSVVGTNGMKIETLGISVAYSGWTKKMVCTAVSTVSGSLLPQHVHGEWMKKELRVA